jgi:hypothetical protein
MGAKMHTHVRTVVGVAAALLIGTSAVVAQTGGGYDLTWSSLGGSGGTAASTGGGYSLGGTIGQPDAGALRGGSYTLLGGFWGAADAPPTPTATLTPTVTATATTRPEVTATPTAATPTATPAGTNATPTATTSPDATATPTATRPPATTPTVAPTLSPCETGLGVTVALDSSHRLQVTVSPRMSPVARVRLVADPRVPSSNALFDVDGGVTGSPTLDVAPGVAPFGFFVRPADANQAVSAPLVVTDGCGTDWDTLVGAGPAVFSGPPSRPAAVAVTPRQGTPTPLPARTATATPTPLRRSEE